MLSCFRATLPHELAINDVTDPFENVDQSTLSDLQFPGLAKKANLTDGGYPYVDDILSTTGERGVESMLSQSIHSHDLELSHTEDITSGYYGHATLYASPGQGEEPSKDTCHPSDLGGIRHSKSIDLHTCRH